MKITSVELGYHINMTRFDLCREGTRNGDNLMSRIVTTSYATRNSIPCTFNSFFVLCKCNGEYIIVKFFGARFRNVLKLKTISVSKTIMTNMRGPINKWEPKVKV